MARFRHRDADRRPPNTISIGPVRDKASVDDDGMFAVDPGRDDYEAVVERLVAAGHDLVGEGERDTGANESDAARASDHSEDELVAMGRNELRTIATHYDDVNGNASADKLTEELIAKRRAEVS